MRVHGPDFEAYRYAIIEKAVGGGIVCALDAHSLRQLMADTTLTFKPHQDIIMRALDELKKNTEAAIAAIASSGSPYTIAAVRALKTHNAAYITFTKVSHFIAILSSITSIISRATRSSSVRAVESKI